MHERLENLTRDYERSFSEKESIRERLIQRLGFYELAGDQLPNIIWTMTPDGDARFISAITRQLGYQENEVTLNDIVSPLKVAALTELVDSAIQSFPPGTEAPKIFKAPSMELEARHKLGHNTRLVIQVILGH